MLPPQHIRRDIFAVKADERQGCGYAYVFMSFSRRKAVAKRDEIKSDTSLGLNRLAKLVYPSQRIAQIYVNLGNRIEQ